MAGRNNRPDKDGAAAKPSRLDQFGDQMSKNDQSGNREAGRETNRP